MKKKIFNKTPEIHLYHLYMLKCRDGSYYTGIAKNVEKRLDEHRNSKSRGSKYVRSRLPVELVYKTPPMQHSNALYLERQLKKISHEEKEEICKFYTFLKTMSEKGNKLLTHKEAYEKVYNSNSTD